MLQIQNMGNLGLSSYRPMHLQKALTYAQNAVGIKPFPGQETVIPAETFDAVVAQTVAKANGENPAGWRTFQEGEAIRDLQQRGYRRGESALIPVEISQPILIPQPPAQVVPHAPVAQPAPVQVLPPAPVRPIYLPPPPPPEPVPAGFVIQPVPGPGAIERPTITLRPEGPAPGIDKKWLLIAVLATVVLTRAA